MHNEVGICTEIIPNFPSKNRLFRWFLPLAAGRKFDTFTALSYYALIANPITTKILKIFVPAYFSVKFMSKKAHKLWKILVLRPKIGNQR